jgi:GntR family transcriptional regulator/MocR family aminotransferase
MTQSWANQIGHTKGAKQIAAVLEQAILAGHIRPGEKLPPMRNLAAEVDVSVTTIATAYRLLSANGRISSQVGRGSFVAAPREPIRKNGHTASPGADEHARLPLSPTLSLSAPWRRRTLSMSTARLRGLYPDAVDCTTGSPDTSLLPWRVLQRKWIETLRRTDHSELQYGGPEPVDSLVKALVPRLTADNIPCRATDFLIGSSAQQLMVLTFDVACALSPHSTPSIAMEEPGYPTGLDTFERRCQVIGICVDEYGAIPSSVETALARGVTAILLTPRAHNPTGASWSTGRMRALAEVLAKFPSVTIIEDDHFADIASTHPGSMLSDPRIEDRVVYVRSFSKAFGPDLRIAAAVVRSRLRHILLDAKGYADGWTSRGVQSVLAAALVEDELKESLAIAQAEYAERRRRAAEGLRLDLGAGAPSLTKSEDGVNLWVGLPVGLEAAHVVERVAALGALVVSGEPFFVRPGRRDAVRLSVGAVSPELAFRAGRLLAEAAVNPIDHRSAVPV